MNTLYLVRGLPGTGKSTIARKLASIVFEADQYFTNPYTGEYKFDASHLDIAHAKCQQNVKCAMMDLATMSSTIAVANTFSRRWEMQPYYDMAKQFQYLVIEITLTSEQIANTHNVPESVIKAMAERWEK